MSDFLKNLQNALENGEEATEYKNKMDEILDKADKMSANEASDKLKNRINAAGERDALSEEERKNVDQEFKEKMKEIERENDKLLRMARLENFKKLIEETKIEYEEIISDMTKELDNMTKEFNELYGETEDNFDSDDDA